MFKFLFLGFFSGRVAHNPRGDSAELPIHPLSHVDIEIKSADEIKQQLDTLCCPQLRVSLCPSAFYAEASPTPCYPSRCRNTIFTRDLSQVHIWLCNSFKDQPLASTHTQRNTKLAYFFAIHSKPLTHAHEQTEAITANTLTLKVCPMHELSKWLSQLQSAKLFSFKSPFFFSAVKWKLPACRSTSQLLSVRLSLTACHPSASDYLSVKCLGWLIAKWCTTETGKVLAHEGIYLLLFCPVCWDGGMCPIMPGRREQRVQMGRKMTFMAVRPHSCRRVQQEQA